VGKDTRLLRLCSELGVEAKEVPKTVAYSPAFGVDLVGEDGQKARAFILEVLDRLRKASVHLRCPCSRSNTTSAALARIEKKRASITFSEFARAQVGDRAYELFKRLVGFTDFESSDVIDTLDDYGFEDNYSSEGDRVAKIPWDRLIRALVERAEAAGFYMRKNARVTSVNISDISGSDEAGHHHPHEVNYMYHARNEALKCRKVVLAVTADALQKILPCRLARAFCPWDRHVHVQPYMRVYAKVDLRASRDFVRAVREYTVVPNELQKIIPIDPKRGVYMIAYSDNACAARLKTRGVTEPVIERLAKEALGLSLSPRDSDVLRILKLKTFHWDAGTHFFSPLPSAFRDRDAYLDATLRPHPDVLVLGEGMSRSQGWTEGALERLERASVLVRDDRHDQMDL